MFSGVPDTGVIDPSAPNNTKGALEAKKNLSLPNFLMAFPTNYSFPT